MHNKHKYNTREKGAALLIFVLLFLFGSSALTYMISKSIYTDFLIYQRIYDSKSSFMMANAGIEDVAYRYINGVAVDPEELFTLGTSVASTTSTLDLSNGQLIIESQAEQNDSIRKSRFSLTLGSGASFNFGVQTGNGGFFMNNTASVIGNVFSNGDIIGGGSSMIRGDVIAAGPGGLVEGVHATGSVRADIIENSTIDQDSFYFTSFINNSYSGSVNGPGWPIEATSSLPFPDSKVEAHKASVTAAIADGVGTHYTSVSPECSSGTWTITSNTVFNGPTKIDCNVVLKKQGSGTKLTVSDTVWIQGNLDFQSGPEVESSPAQATHTVLFIVDNESDRITSSQISVEQGTTFTAPSSPKAYIMLVSMNEDAELGGSNTAIFMGQSSNGDIIVYAGHGKIRLANSIELKEVTAYLIEMGQSSVVEYESGLINLNFTSGPGGGFEMGAWEEIE